MPQDKASVREQIKRSIMGNKTNKQALILNPTLPEPSNFVLVGLESKVCGCFFGQGARMLVRHLIYRSHVAAKFDVQVDVAVLKLLENAVLFVCAMGIAPEFSNNLNSFSNGISCLRSLNSYKQSQD